MKAVALALAFACALPSVAIAADQFDLVCAGTSQRGVQGPKEPAEAHYRIDLAAHLWCRDECAGVSNIQEVTGSQIVFVDMKATSRDGVTMLHYVDRSTGRLTDMMGSDDLYTSTEMTCDRAPFSGLPRTKF